MDVDVARHRRAHELAAEERSLVDQPRIDDAIAEDVLIVVDVLEEEIQRGQALHQSLLDVLPFAGRDDARHRVHRPDPLDALFLPVDGEADAVLQHGQIGHRLAAAELLRGRGRAGDETGPGSAAAAGRGASNISS